MSVATVEPEQRKRWECSDCGVVVRKVDDSAIARPASWTDGRCVACHREYLLKGNRGKGGNRADLVMFELHRGATLSTAAMRAGTSTKVVQKIRAQMLAGGDYEPSPVSAPSVRKRPTLAEQLDAGAELLRESGPLTIDEFAQRRSLVRRTAKKHLSGLRLAGRAAQHEPVPGVKAKLWAAV